MDFYNCIFGVFINLVVYVSPVISKTTAEVAAMAAIPAWYTEGHLEALNPVDLMLSSRNKRAVDTAKIKEATQT